MARIRKGKEVAGKAPAGKRKRDGDGDKDNDKSGGGRKRNRSVLQFFENVAAEAGGSDASDDSDFDDYILEEEFVIESSINKEPGKAQNLPLLPKEEEMNEEEFDKIMEERYKDGSNFVTYAGDDYENKLVETNFLVPSAKDPTIWKVKCMVGRERHSTFCLMQKYVDMKLLGSKLQIISVFSLDHLKGFIYIEAEKQCDINEACKGLSSIYPTRIMPVPKNEVPHLLSSQRKCNEVSEGMWARVKSGKYKGDLAQIEAVNNVRKRATVKLIPRIDLQAMAAKFAEHPFSFSVSEQWRCEFRPLIQYRRDRDTNKVFAILDGLMLKDGYLYKKVSIDSLSCWGVKPSEEELLKFKPSENGESDDLEWLSQLYGEKKKKQVIKSDKGVGKGEGASGSGGVNSFELHDLVCFARKDFGVILGMEKDDTCKILKEGLEGPEVVTVQLHELKSGPADMKFTALDQRMKPISLTDTIRVLEGPSKGRQGIVRQIYRGIIFFYDKNEAENGGYFCAKSQVCEKVKLSMGDEKGGESGPSGFDDFASSPKSPLSPKRPWQNRENNSQFNRGDKDGMFSIGQTLRIRVGPLKGYLCRVLAIRYSDITVKLDSQHKVQRESGSEDPFRSEDGENAAWESKVTPDQSSSWGAAATHEKSAWAAAESNKNASAVSADEKSPWVAAATNDRALDQVHGWEKGKDAWNKAAMRTGFVGSSSNSWDKAVAPHGDLAGSQKVPGDNWGKGNLKIETPADSLSAAAVTWENKTVSDNQGGERTADDPWNKGKSVTTNPTSSWGGATAGNNQLDSWGKVDVAEAGLWEKSRTNTGSGWNQQKSWAQSKEAVDGKDEGTGTAIQEDSWGKAVEKSSSRVETSGSKTAWTNSKPTVQNQNGDWGNAGGNRGRSSNQEQTDDRDKSNAFGDNGKSSWSKDKASSWNKGKGPGESQNTEWTRKATVVDGTQSSGWGSGDAHRGKSVTTNPTSSWGGATAGKNQLDSWGKVEDVAEAGLWEKSRTNSGSGWNQQKSWAQSKEVVDGKDEGTGTAIQEDSWGKAVEKSSSRVETSGSKTAWTNSKPTVQNQTGDWGSAGGNRGRSSNQEQTDDQDKSNAFEDNGKSSWSKDKASSWNKGKGPGESQNTGWTRKANVVGGTQTSGWGSGDAHRVCGDKSSDWNKKTTEDNHEEGNPKDLGGDWNNRKTPDGGSASGWGGQSTGWKSGSNDGQNQATNWSGRSSWNSGSSDANRNQDSSWAKKSDWNGGGSQDSNWGKRSNWNSGSGDANKDSSWRTKSNWDSGNAFDGNQSVAGGSDDQVETFSGKTSGGNSRGGFRGRGSSDRGGFRGRGGFGGRGGDGEFFGGRGRSNRGGFGGRSDRGGFGGRGRGRRDQNGDWNNRNECEDKPSDWNEGAGDGWKNNASAGTWNDGGAGKNKWQSWNAGNCGTSDQSSGWNSKGWNQPTEAKDAAGSEAHTSGWNKGRVSTNEAGGSKGNNMGSSDASGGSQWSGWGKSTMYKETEEKNPQGGGWSSGPKSSTHSGGWNNQGSGWNKGTSAGNGGGSGDQAPSWSRSNDAEGGQTSSWNQSKDARGANGDGEPTSSWDKAGASSWGKGRDKSGKGGW
ncbi:hypothetical protein CJ030_MR3G015069 [Morella rubra]|uniref:KOW domain-containing protein n=1 Tax=Morella rubra TaxID=262757 RepID=A0A6A1W1P5_9ROSI|nr:hypothetical protein CJ030_MR3G015069 [Morella rubra]